MQIKYQQLARQLENGLAPVYFFGGDELLLVQEAADAVRAAALQQGYDEREVLEVEPGFNWQQLREAGATLSLFAERRILDLRLPTGKPGIEGAKALTAYCKQIPEDNLLLITAGRVESSARKSKWMKELDRVGVVMQAWPLSDSDMRRWLHERLAKQGLQVDSHALQPLAERVEGNLLAAAQEVDKLALLHPPGAISEKDIMDAVVDSSHFDIFDLANACLGGDVPQVSKVLASLRGEGVEPILILWVLTREIRAANQLIRRLSSGMPANKAFMELRIFKPRQGLLQNALKRHSPAQWRQLLQAAAQADLVLKGGAAGRVWDELLELAAWLASGQRLIAA